MMHKPYFWHVAMPVHVAVHAEIAKNSRLSGDQRQFSGGF